METQSWCYWKGLCCLWNTDNILNYCHTHQQPGFFSPSCISANSRIIKIQTMLSSMSNSPAYAVLFQELCSANANTWHRSCSNSCPVFKHILTITHGRLWCVGYLFFCDSSVLTLIFDGALVINLTCIHLDMGWIIMECFPNAVHQYGLHRLPDMFYLNSSYPASKMFS